MTAFDDLGITTFSDDPEASDVSAQRVVSAKIFFLLTLSVKYLQIKDLASTLNRK